MTAALAPDVLEAELLQPAPGRHVDLDGPRTDGFEPQLTKTQGQQLGRRLRRVAAVPLTPEHGPHRRGRLEAAIHVRQAHDADRQVAVMGREYAEHVQIALRHHLERNRRRAVDAVAEIQPLAVVLLAQPFGYELDQLGAVQRQELHSRTNFPSRSGDAPLRLPFRTVRAATPPPGPRAIRRGQRTPNVAPVQQQGWTGCTGRAPTCISAHRPRALSWSMELRTRTAYEPPFWRAAMSAARVARERK